MSQTINNITDQVHSILEKLEIKFDRKSDIHDKLNLVIGGVMHHKSIEKKELSNLLKQKIIQKILDSDLNLDFVPDFLEKQIYDMIFDVLEKYI